MASVFDAAKYILHRMGRLSTMKLQKLCYYAQAWSLVWDDEPLFDEDFRAWVNGPVCFELFAQTRGRFSITEGDEPGDLNALSDEQKDSIDHVIDFYGGRDAQYLSELTHLEDPWILARNGLPMGAPCENVISKESMAMYYSGL